MKIHLDDEDVRPVVPTSLTATRARKFLECIRDNPFVCVAVDEEGMAIKIFTRGDESIVNYLITCLIVEETQEQYDPIDNLHHDGLEGA